MSRGGGRGGGRGARGGARGGMLGNMTWEKDENLQLDGRPTELFPAYNVPLAAPLSKREEKQVSYFLLFREQVHDGPLYTQTRTWELEQGRTYGQEQINKRYGVKSKATVDPFLAMPTYSQRYNRQDRALPELASRPFAKEFFPPELHATLDGDDGPAGGAGGAAKRRKTNKKHLALSNIATLRTAEDIFLPESMQQELADAESHNKALQLLDKIDGNEDVDDMLLGEEDDDWVRTNGDGEEVEEEDEYEDESGDDYNAEQYFEGNQDDDDYGDDGDGGGDDFF